MLSKLILTEKIMRKNKFKIQMLAGNRLKIRVGAGFELSLTLNIILSDQNIYEFRHMTRSPLLHLCVGKCEFILS